MLVLCGLEVLLLLLVRVKVLVDEKFLLFYDVWFFYSFNHQCDL